MTDFYKCLSDDTDSSPNHTGDIAEQCRSAVQLLCELPQVDGELAGVIVAPLLDHLQRELPGTLEEAPPRQKRVRREVSKRSVAVCFSSTCADFVFKSA